MATTNVVRRRCDVPVILTSKQVSRLTYLLGGGWKAQLLLLGGADWGVYSRRGGYSKLRGRSGFDPPMAAAAYTAERLIVRRPGIVVGWFSARKRLRSTRAPREFHVCSAQRVVDV